MSTKGNTFRFMCVEANPSRFLTTKVISQDRRRSRRVITGETSPIFLAPEDIHNYARRAGCPVIVRVKAREFLR